MARPVKFPENLRKLRKSARLTQAMLADKLGVDQRTVSAWENGIAQPNFETLAAICDIFGETFDSLLTDCLYTVRSSSISRILLFDRKTFRRKTFIPIKTRIFSFAICGNNIRSDAVSGGECLTISDFYERFPK